MPVQLWICQACGRPHMVSPIQLGRFGACRGCKQQALIVNHTHDEPAQARGRELREARKRRLQVLIGNLADPTGLPSRVE